MPKKLTLADVQQYLVENDKNHECTLLSTEYKTSKDPLLFRCNICGKEFERDFGHLKRGRFCCRSCSMSRAQIKHTIDEVKQYLIDNNASDIILLSTEYKNSSTPLEFQCKCGKKFTKSYDHLISDKYIMCSSCAHKINGFQKKYTKEDAFDICQSLGYIMLGDYVDTHTPVLCRCAAGHEFKFYLTGYLNDRRQCPKCAIIARSGENAYNWKGGITSLSSTLRNATSAWRSKILEETPYCDISGETQDLEVHHLDINFSDVVTQALSDLNLPLHASCGEYSTEEIESLRQYVKEAHKNIDGVVLTKELHRKFHNMFGYGNNTSAQYKEFKTLMLKERTDSNGTSNNNPTDDSA